MSINKNSLGLKIGILSISALLTAAGAVSGAVPMMAKIFKDHSTVQVQGLITLPSIAMVIFILMSAFFIKILGKRKTVLLGLTLGLIGGIVPFFTDNFTVIQVSRFILGAGNGLYSTSTASLIGDIWQGDEQRHLLGVQSAVQTFGQSLATFLAGVFLQVNWHAAFLVYLIFLPIIILFSMGYTKNIEEDIKKNQQVNKGKTNEKSKNVPVLALVAILMSFLYFNAIMPQSTASGLAIQEMGLDHQEMLSTVLAIGGIVGAIVTSFYGYIYKLFKHYTPVFIMILGIIGYTGMTHATSMIMFSFFMIVTSTTSLIFPYIYGAVMEDVPSVAKDFALSIAKVFNNFGSFLSPYSMAFTAQIFGMSGAVATLTIAKWYLVFVGVVFLILAIVRKKQSKVTVETI